MGNPSAEPIAECCRWCRQPVSQCRHPACDDTSTYTGRLRYGRWVEAAGEGDPPPPPAPPPPRTPAAGAAD